MLGSFVRRMAREFAKAFYKSKAWQSCRKSYIAQRILVDGGKCERCRRLPGFILHHKVKLTPTNIMDPDISLNHCNLEYVCKPCHDNEHSEDIYGKKTAVVIFGTDGQIIPIDDR